MKIIIDGREAHDYVVNEVVFNYDTLADTFSLSRPFFEHWEVAGNVNRETFRMFRPLQYYDVKITDDNGKVLLTGTILNHHFSATAEQHSASLSGYSRAGILEDCSNVQEALKNALTVDSEGEALAEKSTFNMVEDAILDEDEDTKTGDSTCFSDISLLDFATQLCAPFGIKVFYDNIVADRVKETYDITKVKDNETVGQTLAKLATLKNIVVRSTLNGHIKFTQIDSKKDSVMRFGTGNSRVYDASLEVNGQAMHSLIYLTGAASLEEEEQTDAAKTGDTVKIFNPLVKKDRPIVRAQSVEKGTLLDPVKAHLAEELKNITVNISCKGWDFVDGDIIRPGDIITVNCHSIYLYQDTRLVVRQITLKQDAKGKTQTLACVLPEAYTGETPKNIF